MGAKKNRVREQDTRSISRETRVLPRAPVLSRVHIIFMRQLRRLTKSIRAGETRKITLNLDSESLLPVVQVSKMSSKHDSDESATSNTNLLDFARKGFALASNYEKVRQDYPIEAVKFFLQNLRLMDNNTVQVKVLELGSGTGKFTRVMLEVLKDQDVRVIASDPFKHMCEHFKHLLPGIDIIQCTAEKISKYIICV